MWRWPCRAPSTPRHAPLRTNVVSMFCVVCLWFAACCACLETPSKKTFAKLFVDDSLVWSDLSVWRTTPLRHALDAMHACVFWQVLLAGGAISSPQVLMLSGVGPEQHLKSKVQCSQRWAFAQPVSNGYDRGHLSCFSTSGMPWFSSPLWNFLMTDRL